MARPTRKGDRSRSDPDSTRLVAPGYDARAQVRPIRPCRRCLSSLT